MQDPEYDNAPHLSMNLCEHLRIPFDGVKGEIDDAEKPFAKAFDLLFVVRDGICKVPSDLASEDERQGH